MFTQLNICTFFIRDVNNKNNFIIFINAISIIIYLKKTYIFY